MVSKNFSRVVLKVNCKKISNNLKKIKKQIQNAKLMVILKANAYGMGAEKIAEICLQNNVTTIGVADFSEAEKLLPILKKQNKVQKTSLQIIGGVFKNEIEECIKNNIILPIENEAMAKLIHQVAKKKNKKAKVHLLIDTGMGRLGFHHEETKKIIAKILLCKNLFLEGIYSHFSSANSFDKQSKNYTKNQVTQILELKKKFPDFLYHLANSDGINNYPHSYFDMVRTGINLYGVFDLKNNPIYQLEPVLTLETKIIALKKKKMGDFIGYDRTYRLSKEQWIATIPVGYADGIPLALSNRGKVIIRSNFYSIVGKISMDYTTIAIGKNEENIKINDKVLLIGEKKDKKITVENWAEIKKTHPYDILCSIGNRIERIYTKLN